jgi:SNF2-related domain
MFKLTNFTRAFQDRYEDTQVTSIEGTPFVVTRRKVNAHALEARSDVQHLTINPAALRNVFPVTDLHTPLVERCKGYKLYTQDPKDYDDAIVLAKLFDPMGTYTAFITGYDPKDRLAFGFVSIYRDHCDELGSISIDECMSMKIELDLYWTPKSLRQAKASLYGTPALSNDKYQVNDATVAVLSSGETVSDELESDIDAPVVQLPLDAFLKSFGNDLMQQMQAQNPALYQSPNASRSAIMDGLLRKPFKQQAASVQALMALLLDHDQPAAVLNAEMGTGKTIMGIAAAAVMHAEGFTRTLVICPPHLVYKWRREILLTMPNAKVWILNGADTLKKLLELRKVGLSQPTEPTFFIMGRVRMRLGFHWKPSFAVRKVLMSLNLDEQSDGVDRGAFGRGQRHAFAMAHCGQCMRVIERTLVDMPVPLTAADAEEYLGAKRIKCQHCESPLWTLMRPTSSNKSSDEVVQAALTLIPTIGDKTAQALIHSHGAQRLQTMLTDSPAEFANLMDDEGNFVFTDRKARRIEKSLGDIEFSFGQGGYQPTEFIKRYLPQGFFSLLIADEGHEYKNEGSAQGQAMGVLARKATKTLLLTGTLMGGYASDLFHLLWRLNPAAMIEDGFKYNERGTLASAELAFMREHGILIDILKERDVQDHKTSRAKTQDVSTKKGPGFGPAGIMRYVLPITVFLRLRDIEGANLPPYQEFFTEVAMNDEMQAAYLRMRLMLSDLLKRSLVKGDRTLLGLVMTVLLAWPECSFRNELVKHPRIKDLLYQQKAISDEFTPTPKEIKLLELCKDAKTNGRKTLVYAIYTGVRDTTSRLKTQLETAGLKVAVLRATVKADEREDWLIDQVERNVDVVITNPELVKTGLDMLEFPTIVFMQSGYNVYTVQQAARRSWRIGQKHPVEVHYLGYGNTMQMDCLRLMGKKIAVSQSTSGDMQTQVWTCSTKTRAVSNQNLPNNWWPRNRRF